MRTSSLGGLRRAKANKNTFLSITRSSLLAREAAESASSSGSQMDLSARVVARSSRKREMTVLHRAGGRPP